MWSRCVGPVRYRAAMDEVPEWCDFFTEDEYAAFYEEADDAFGMFGADGRDLGEGYGEMVAGEGLEFHAFPLAPLARRCRDADRAEWSSLCSDQVDAWATAKDQHAWLERAAFTRFRDHLRVQFETGGPRFQDTRPDDPREAWRRPIADGLWLELFVQEVPGATEDDPEIDTYANNAAVRAWGVPPDGLVAIALANLRAEAAPTWAEIRPGVLGSWTEMGWALMLEETLPDADGALVAIPKRDRLLVAPPSAPPDAIAEEAAVLYGQADVGSRVSGAVYRHRRGSFTRVA